MTDHNTDRIESRRWLWAGKRTAKRIKVALIGDTQPTRIQVDLYAEPVKWCPDCGASRPLAEFDDHHGNGPDNKQGYCREHMKGYQAGYARGIRRR